MRKPTWPFVRDVSNYVAGLAVLTFEVVARRPIDVSSIPLIAGFMLGPQFGKRDLRAKRRNAADGDHDLPGD